MEFVGRTLGILGTTKTLSDFDSDSGIRSLIDIAAHRKKNEHRIVKWHTTMTSDQDF